MTRSRRHSDNHEPESPRRFRHTSRADRPSALALFLRRHKRAMKSIAVLGVVGVAGWFFVSSHRGDAILFPLKKEIETLIPLKVTQIRIEGENLTSHQTIRQALGIAVGDPMLGFDVKGARERLNALPFVEDATVERRFSGAIIVHLTERPPFAVWQHKGQFVLIDRDGNPVPDKGMTSKDAQAFLQLPLVVGEGAEHAAAELLDAMTKAPDVKSRLTAATLVGMRRWNLTLKDGAIVYLPEAAEPQALTKLEELQQRMDLLDRPVEVIDMRLPDRLTIRERPAPPVASDETPSASSAPQMSPAAPETHGTKSDASRSGGKVEGGEKSGSGVHPTQAPHHDNDHASTTEGALPT